MQKRPLVSAIILDYQKSRRVALGVESLFAQVCEFDLEVIVVDNTATPEARAKLAPLVQQGVQLIFNEHNLGYPAGINRGVAAARGEYLLIVNPDIVWRDADVLAKLVQYLEQNKSVAVVGPRQCNETDGKQALTVRAWPRLWVQVVRRTWLRRLPLLRQAVAYDEMQHLDLTQIQSVDWLQSSCWLARRSMWDTLGGLGEDYFVFMADPDYCYRAWTQGWQTVYLASTTVWADGLRASAGGVGRLFTSRALRIHVLDALKYWWRYLGRGNPRLTKQNEKC
jgi:GT2 family glycosyltransferase